MRGGLDMEYIAFVASLITALIGITRKETWKDGRPSLIGWFLIATAIISCGVGLYSTYHTNMAKELATQEVKHFQEEMDLFTKKVSMRVTFPFIDPIESFGSNYL